MTKIIVMCENVLQFREYVGSMLRDRNKLPIKVSYEGSSTIVYIHGVDFIYCNQPHILKGRSFCKDDHLIKIGSWYNIPNEIQKAIITEFNARIVK